MSSTIVSSNNDDTSLTNEGADSPDTSDSLDSSFIKSIEKLQNDLREKWLGLKLEYKDLNFYEVLLNVKNLIAKNSIREIIRPSIERDRKKYLDFVQNTVLKNSFTIQIDDITKDCPMASIKGNLECFIEGVAEESLNYFLNQNEHMFGVSQVEEKFLKSSNKPDLELKTISWPFNIRTIFNDLLGTISDDYIGHRTLLFEFLITKSISILEKKEGKTFKRDSLLILARDLIYLLQTYYLKERVWLIYNRIHDYSRAELNDHSSLFMASMSEFSDLFSRPNIDLRIKNLSEYYLPAFLYRSNECISILLQTLEYLQVLSFHNLEKEFYANKIYILSSYKFVAKNIEVKYICAKTLI